jgi:hypothetical protein
MLQRFNIKRVFIGVGIVQTGAAYAKAVDQILHGSAIVPFVPKQVHRLFKHFIFIKIFCPCHSKKALPAKAKLLNFHKPHLIAKPS